MSTESEGTFDIGHVSLYTKTWTPQGPIRARLIMVHGFSDHLGCYMGLFPHLASRGIQVSGWDQRGWGRSVRKPSDKGLTGPTSLVLSDVAAFVRPHLADSGIPVFVLGHSMGGAEAILLASTAEYDDIVSKVRGWILESPFIAFPKGDAPNPLKVFFGRLAGRLLPHRTLVSVVPPEHLSRDKEVQKRLAEDKLCHNTGTLEGLAGMLDRADTLESGKARLRPAVRSVFVAHGTADRVCSFDASKKWFDSQKVDDGTYKAYNECYHQLHSDLCRDEFYTDVGDWILARCDGTKPVDDKPATTAEATDKTGAAAEADSTQAEGKQGESKL